MDSKPEKKSHEPEEYVSDEDGRGPSVNKNKGPKALFRNGDQVWLRIAGQLPGPYRVYPDGRGKYLLTDDAGNYVNAGEAFSPQNLEPVKKKK